MLAVGASQVVRASAGALLASPAVVGALLSIVSIPIAIAIDEVRWSGSIGARSGEGGFGQRRRRDGGGKKSQANQHGDMAHFCISLFLCRTKSFRIVMGTGKFKNGVYHAADGLVVAVELMIERIDHVHAGGGARHESEVARAGPERADW